MSQQHHVHLAGMPYETAAAGEMGRLIGSRDWSGSPVGPPSGWTPTLAATLGFMLPSGAEIVLFWGPDYVAFYNDAYTPTIGDKHPHALGRPAREHWGELWDDLGPLLDRVRTTGETFKAKDRPFYIERGAAGETVYFDISYSAVPEADGSVGGVMCIVSETTARVRAEQATAAQRDRIWEMSQDPMLVADLDGIWQAASPAWERVLGWSNEELVGRTSEWLEHPDDRAKTRAEVQALAEGEATVAFENRFRTRDGSYRTLSWRAVAAKDSLYCVARDVTEQRAQAALLEETEERLRQAQKMETLGQLTGGIAHDFNNLLQIVIGNLETMQRQLPEDAARLRRAAANAMTGANRAAVLTQRLLAFARRQPLAPRAVDMNRLLSGMAELLDRTLGETIEVETVISPRLWPTEVDPNQLEMAILNLAVNARDAMPGGGRLTIETSNTHLDRDYAGQHVEVAPGQYVMLCVSDTGEGMDAGTLAHVFEPFFTTKEVGKGTGLGLSMVYGFVKQSGGHVKIYSEPGEGTTVRIYLPRMQGEAADEEQAAPVAVLGGSREELILVCEDDADVRAYTVDLLQELGYRVIAAGDGPTALRALGEAPGPIDLLFTDVVLPGGMTGADLAAAARVRQPGLKVLFTTGYARNAIVHHGRLDAGVELITKPFTYAALMTRIRDILDGS